MDISDVCRIAVKCCTTVSLSAVGILGIVISARLLTTVVRHLGPQLEVCSVIFITLLVILPFTYFQTPKNLWYVCSGMLATDSHTEKSAFLNPFTKR